MATTTPANIHRPQTVVYQDNLYFSPTPTLILVIYILTYYTIKFSSTTTFYYFFFKNFSISSIIFALKFILLVAILVFVRGGIPRYRYDFLTKLGWIKTFSLILSIFLSSLLLLSLN